ncbi:hypothetical protein RHGRI_034835 [Rhododendron griersonianum]|uniref:Uncharacterized protein n=1 Tax=Rhododendron griersonianum TaxID=479676 RepID=A0AAV6I4Z4_9ERIC|nr:hypothetical protein RHGRI_034835 [Rhododendron griersonianum]
MAMMARTRKFWNHSKAAAAALIWVSSAILFYCVLQMALRNSSPINHPSSSASSSDASISNAEKRAIIYEKMARDLDEHGAAFLKHGETSQSLSLSDLFAIKDGSITPILKLPFVVRLPSLLCELMFYIFVQSTRFISRKSFILLYVVANMFPNSVVRNGPGNILQAPMSLPAWVILPMWSPGREAVRSVFLPYFDKMIWFQNSTLYHFSMFHASHHIAPVLATEYEIKAEANAVKAVAEGLCPLKIVLDRVVLTSTGVLLGCWQVTSGTDPVTIRAKLRSALPRAPGKQLYDAAILHTSFARLLGRPNTSPEEADETRFFHDLVTRLNNKLNGFLAMVSELWYVEEFDVLALALDGKMKVRKFQLGCSQT